MAKKKSFQNDSTIAVIYARYSSHAQKDASIEQQVQEGTEYAKENNLAVTHVYADRAVSGKTDRRTDFQRMMRDASKGEFKYVIAWKSNRMGRNMLDAMMNEAKLQSMGVRVLYTEEDFDDTAAGRFALRSMMNVNQFYSENMAEDIKRGLAYNASNCMITNGTLPFGYKKGEDGKYAISESEALIVKEIFMRVACREAFIDIANDLNARGILTKRGNQWGKGSFHRLLVNERYTGVYIYDDIRVEGGVPQIVGKELFLQVQDILKTKKNPQGRHRENGDYLLTGKIYCGKCKSHMTGMSGTAQSGKLHFYYACQHKQTGKICDKKAVRRDWIERTVAEGIRKYIMRDDVIAWMADSVVEYAKEHKERTNIDILEGQLAEAKRATKNLLTAIEQGIVTPTTKDRLLELEAEQTRLSNCLIKEHAKIFTVSRDDVISSLEAFREGNINDKKYQAKLFDMFLVAVYLYDDELRLVFNYSGKKNSVSIPFVEETIDSVGDSEFTGGSYKLPIEPPDKERIEPS